MDAWEDRCERALANSEMRGALLGFQRAWRESRAKRIAELEEQTGRTFDHLRHELAETKRSIVKSLPDHVSRFRVAAEAAGAVVAEVSDAEEARRYVRDLLAARGTRLVVKGKSMVSEEGLNHRAAARTLDPV
jgi:L-lactate dehydrogenase complex protein LldF